MCVCAYVCLCEYVCIFVFVDGLMVRVVLEFVSDSARNYIILYYPNE